MHYLLLLNTKYIICLWEGFSSRSPINWYCPLWFMCHEFVQSHIEERRLLHVPYKLEPKTHGSQNGQYLLIGGRDEKPSHMFHYIKFIKKKLYYIFLHIA